MDLLDLLPVEHVVVPLRAPDVRAALIVLVDRLEAVGAMEPSDSLRQRIASEEVREVVAVSDAVALPHYRTDSVSTLTLALGLSPEPLPDAPGGEGGPRIVALILTPPETTGLYLQTTSTLARILSQESVVEAMSRQPDAEHVVALPSLQGVPIRPSLVVRDVMAHRIVSVPPEATVRRTLDIILRRKLNAVTVVGEKGEVLGMITEADIMRALLPLIPRTGAGDEGLGEAPEDRPVRDIMTRSVLCVSEDLGVREAASMMINKNVEQLPVVNAGIVTGMVFRRDILRKLFGSA